MNWTGAFVVALLALAGIGKAISDSQAHGSPRLARWLPGWAGPLAWRNKYRGGDPALGSKFWLSTTLLVAFTDLWHAMNLLAWLCADAALLLAAWAGPGRWWAVAGVAARRLVFQPLYSFLRK